MDLAARGATERSSAAAVPSGEDAASSVVAPPRSPPSAAAAAHPETPQDVPESPTVKHTPTSGLTEGDGLSWMSSRLRGGRRIQSHPPSRPTSRGSVSWDPALPASGGGVPREREEGDLLDNAPFSVLRLLLAEHLTSLPSWSWAMTHHGLLDG